jgi:[histone H3]-trimethyl-L-lysine4 demethylase
MLDSFSKDLIYTKLDLPTSPTLFIDLVKYVPGQPDIGINNPHSQAATRYPPPVSVRGFTNGSQYPASLSAPSSSYTSHVPNPPWNTEPWSRWAPTTSMVMPPSHPQAEAMPSRKRKLPDDTEESRYHRPHQVQSLSSPSLTMRRDEPRYAPPPPAPPPAPSRTPPPSTRPRQTLSPSLAMIMSPPDEVMSPRMKYTSTPSRV